MPPSLYLEPPRTPQSASLVFVPESTLRERYIASGTPTFPSRGDIPALSSQPAGHQSAYQQGDEDVSRVLEAQCIYLTFPAVHVPSNGPVLSPITEHSNLSSSSTIISFLLRLCFNYKQLNYHLYNKSAAPYPDLTGHHHGFFISDDIREELHRKSENVWFMPSQQTGLPDEVHNYHSLVPLEPMGPDRRKYFGHWTTACYRATSTLDGCVYVLRRVESKRVMKLMLSFA